MKLKINEDVKSAVVEAAKFADKDKTSLYNRLKLCGKGNDLIIAAANGHACYITKLQLATGDLQEEGECSLPAEMLVGAVSRFQDGILTVQANVFTAHKGKKRLSHSVDTTQNAFGLPSLKSDDCQALKISTIEFINGLSTVAYAMAPEDTPKPILNSVNISVKDGCVRFDALDNYILARYGASSCAKTEDNGKSFNLPRWVVVQCLNDKRFSASNEVTLKVTPKYFIVETENIKIVTAKLDGDYLNVDKLLPDELFTLKLNTKELKEALSTLELVEADKKLRIPLILNYDSQTGDVLSLHMQSSVSKFDNDFDVQASENAESIRIGFSPELLKRAVLQIATDEISIGLTRTLLPTLIRPVCEENTDYAVHLVLPVRLNDVQPADTKGDEAA